MSKLRQAAQEAGDNVLVRFIDIAQFTGMRLSEVAQIGAEGSIATVDGAQCLKVREMMLRLKQVAAGWCLLLKLWLPEFRLSSF